MTVRVFATRVEIRPSHSEYRNWYRSAAKRTAFKQRKYIFGMQDLRSRSPLGHRIHAVPGHQDSTQDGSDDQQWSTLDNERASLLGSTPSKESKLITQIDAKQPIDWMMATLLFLFPAVGGFLFGYDIGASSGALLSMSSPTLSGTDWYQLSSLQSGLVVSLSLAGALLGSGAALVYGDSLGRKKELLLAAALYIAGALSVALAPSLPAVFAGRIIYGVGIGFAMHAAPAYIAETSPARVRGLLISLKECLIVGGILGGYALGYLTVEEIGGWRVMYGTAAPLAVLFAAGMAWLPESPRWLVLSGKGKSTAMAALKRTKGRAADSKLIQDEIDEIEATIFGAGSSSPTARNASSNTNNNAFFDSLSVVLQPKYRRPLTVGISLMLFQQITGQPSVLYYAAKIFQEAGFSSAGEATAISVILGVFKLVMTGIAVLTVDSWGRRPLLLTGVSGIIVSLLVLGAVQSGTIDFLFPNESANIAPMLNVLALLAYVGAYQMSFGPISWLIVGEVFPLRMRGQAIALATLTNFLSNFLVSLVLPTLQDSIGQASIYFAFGVIGGVALVAINNIVPETKGRSLEEIEKMWDHEQLSVVELEPPSDSSRMD